MTTPDEWNNRGPAGEDSPTERFIEGQRQKLEDASEEEVYDAMLKPLQDDGWDNRELQGKVVDEPALTEQQSLDDLIEECLAQAPSLVTHEELAEYKRRAQACLEAAKQEAIKIKYDVNAQGIFIGDAERAIGADRLYWSYVEQFVADYDNYSLDYIKGNMPYAGFGKVGIHKMLARADQYAHERIAYLSSTKHQEGQG